MIKLCVDARMINSSGIGTYLKNVVKNLDRNIFDIHLLINPSKENLETYSSFGMIPTHLPIYSIKEQIVLPFKIPFCDIFWSPHFNIPLFPIKAKKRVVSIHDLYHMHYYDALKWKEKKYAKAIISRSIKKSEIVITGSNFSKDELIKYFPFSESKIDVIYYGVDKQNFKGYLDKQKVWETLKKYSLFSRYFLFVGNFKAHKNLEGLLKAFSLLCDRTRADCNLIIIGKKEGLKNCFDVFSHVKEKKMTSRIHVLSKVPDEDLAIIYSEAIALIYPSFYEGFGLPPLEAMSAKTAVIASNRASISEICEEAAYYIDPDKPEEIAEGMALFINNEEERKRYIKLGDLQKDKFNWKKTAKLHEQTFIRIANENSCNP